MTRARAALHYLAVTWLNTTILFLLIAAVLGVRYARIDARRRAAAEWHYNRLALHSLPAERAEEVFRGYLSLSDRELFVRRPAVGFSEHPLNLPGITVVDGNPLPVRFTPPPSGGAQPARVVWIFGGSTVFGWGVPDEKTLPAALQRFLQQRIPGASIRVVNHGHVSHYSSQEVTLMEELLKAGQRADFVVFVDGLNESWHDLDFPDFAGMREPLDPPESDRPIRISDRFPPARLWRSIQRKMRHHGPPQDSNPADAPPAELRRRAADAARIYETNVKIARAVARSAGMRTLFVWQPTPFDAEPPDAADERVRQVRASWPVNGVMQPLTERARELSSGDDVLFLGGFFARRPFLDTYVDSCHYGDRASEELAATIGEAMVARWSAPLR
jgi:hypothetical protein